MEIEALKKIFQIPVVGKQKEVTTYVHDQKKRKPFKKEKEENKGKVDIKV
jgi:hypothetical protein